MPNLEINGNTYNGVTSVKIPNTGGTLEEFIQPSGDKTITSNGTVDVAAFAQAIVNVPTSVSGDKNIVANGTYDVAAFAQAIVNVPTSGGITNIDTGTATPTSVTRLDIPVDITKGDPIVIMAWSDDAYAANRSCGYIGIIGVYNINGVKDCVYIPFASSSTNGIMVSGIKNHAKNEDGSYYFDRYDTSYSLNTSDTFNYIVFYKPIGDLSFGGASE